MFVCWRPAQAGLDGPGDVANARVRVGRAGRAGHGESRGAQGHGSRGRGGSTRRGLRRVAGEAGCARHRRRRARSPRFGDEPLARPQRRWRAQLCGAGARELGSRRSLGLFDQQAARCGQRQRHRAPDLAGQRHRHRRQTDTRDPLHAFDRPRREFRAGAVAQRDGRVRCERVDPRRLRGRTRVPDARRGTRGHGQRNLDRHALAEGGDRSRRGLHGALHRRRRELRARAAPVRRCLPVLPADRLPTMSPGGCGWARGR